jgi:UDPglucose 6-dehydrogenase
MPSRVCVIGLWHLGTVSAVGFAELGLEVIGVDDDAMRIERLKSGNPPLFEPGLEDALREQVAGGHLHFTTDYAEALHGARYVVLAFDTPVNDQDEVDLTTVFRAVENMAPWLKPEAVVIVSSQVPVGTCEQLDRMIWAANPARPFGLACVPENLRLGSALDCFRHPSMVVIGAQQRRTQDRVEALYEPLPAPKIRMSLRSAEMTKHAINAYLATCVSYINELANLCDAAGANAEQVAAALQLDGRVSPRAPLRPGGVGFAGATLARDLRVLQAVGRSARHPTHLVDAVLAVNQEQRRLVARRLRSIFGSLAGLTIGILGLTYKPGTSTLRRSAALEIAQALHAGGARVKGYDPKADAEELRGQEAIEVCVRPEDAASNSDALVIVTNWPEFRQLDFSGMGKLMRNQIVIDASNLLDGEQMRALGFAYCDVGRGSKLPQAIAGRAQKEVALCE